MKFNLLNALGLASRDIVWRANTFNLVTHEVPHGGAPASPSVLISVRNWAEIGNYFRYALTRLREREARFSSANSGKNRCAGVIIPKIPVNWPHHRP